MNEKEQLGTCYICGEPCSMEYISHKECLDKKHNHKLALKIYNALNEKGAGLGDISFLISVLIIENILNEVHG